MEKLQKILSSRGVASRRQAEKLIESGAVTVNGKVCGIGDRADPETDDIRINGGKLPEAERPVYLMLNKPRGYVTTLSDEKGRSTVAQLTADCGKRVYPVGRLDMDSEGLLILTNDGAFANRLMHPSHGTEKTYRVWVRGYSRENLEKLRLPVELDGYRISPPAVTAPDADGAMEITIHEGRNRQIRRMCELAGMQVVRLQRIREGTLSLGDLPPGKWRYLTDREISCLTGG